MMIAEDMNINERISMTKIVSFFWNEEIEDKSVDSLTASVQVA